MLSALFNTKRKLNLFIRFNFFMLFNREVVCGDFLKGAIALL